MLSTSLEIVRDSADPFIEVKKKRDKSKEVCGFCSSFGLSSFVSV